MAQFQPDWKEYPVTTWLAVWERLADQGACDAPGGKEFGRLLAEWLKGGPSEEPESFIRREANRGAER